MLSMVQLKFGEENDDVPFRNQIVVAANTIVQPLTQFNV